MGINTVKKNLDLPQQKNLFINPITENEYKILNEKYDIDIIQNFSIKSSLHYEVFLENYI